jgi:hypothetical protein
VVSSCGFFLGFFLWFLPVQYRTNYCIYYFKQLEILKSWIMMGPHLI